MTSHFIHFFGGGEVVFAFFDQDKIIDCRGLSVLLTVVNGRELVFAEKPS